MGHIYLLFESPAMGIWLRCSGDTGVSSRAVLMLLFLCLRGAGTDAKVSITMFGQGSRDSGVRRLENSKNNFERGNGTLAPPDTFFVDIPDLGEVKSMLSAICSGAQG